MKIYDVKHDPKDKNRFCGPSAISALTGMSSGEAARLIRATNRLKAVMGTHTGELIRALHKCGIEVTPRKVYLRYYKNKKGEMVAQGEESIAAWLKRTVKDRTPGRVFLLAAGHHWQVISGRRYVCGLSGEIVSITDKKVKRRAKVTEVWECFAPNGVTIPDEAKKAKQPKDWIQRRNHAAYLDFRKFARKHDLQYSIYPECGLNYITISPTKLWPDGLETLHYNFEETMQRLQACIENPALVEDGYYSE
jgi:hypothetical protein